MRNTIETKYSLTKEGSNLSQYGDDVPEIHTILISMCRERDVEGDLKEAVKKKKMKLNNDLTSKEAEVISTCSSTSPVIAEQKGMMRIFDKINISYVDCFQRKVMQPQAADNHLDVIPYKVTLNSCMLLIGWYRQVKIK